MIEPSDAERAAWTDATREYVDYLERVLDAATRAYGALWRDIQTSPSSLSREGRALLREAIDIKHRRIGVEWAQMMFGRASAREAIAADMRDGVFPERSTQD